MAPNALVNSRLPDYSEIPDSLAEHAPEQPAAAQAARGSAAARALASMALLRAAAGGDARGAALALGQGADPDARSADGSSALMLAASSGSALCLAEILPKADPAARAFDGAGALAWAASIGALDCLELLLSRLDPGCADIHGEGALEAAARAGHGSCALALARALAELGALDQPRALRAARAASDSGHPDLARQVLQAALESPRKPGQSSAPVSEKPSAPPRSRPARP